MRKAADTAVRENPDLIAVFASVHNGKVTFACACGKDAIAKGAHAGNIVREVAKTAGGSGGGKPDSAMAGAKDPSAIPTALEKGKEIVENFLKA